MAEERARRREEATAREEAAQERRRALEEERRAKLRELDVRRRDQVGAPLIMNLEPFARLLYRWLRLHRCVRRRNVLGRRLLRRRLGS